MHHARKNGKHPLQRDRPIAPSPLPVVQVGVKLGAEQAALGQQLAHPLAPESKVPGQGPVEEDHGLAGKAAVLGRPEGQDAHARLPGQRGRRRVLRHEGVGEARARPYGRAVRAPWQSPSPQRPRPPGKPGRILSPEKWTSRWVAPDALNAAGQQSPSMHNVSVRAATSSSVSGSADRHRSGPSR